MRGAVLSLFANPNIAFAALLLGITAFYVEMMLIGKVLPAMLGCLLVSVAWHALSQHHTTGQGVTLLLASSLCFLLRIRLPYEALGVAGTACLLSGSWLLLPAPHRIHPAVVILCGLPFSLLTWFLATVAYQAWANKQIE